MKFQELIILLPCHSLEDFPQHHEGDEAAGLLANWTALWHPALLATAKSAPQWYRVDDPPADLEDRLILIPSVSIDQIATGFPQRAKEAGACVLRGLQDRAEIHRHAFEVFEGEAAAISQQLVADYLALGYCFLQIQLLTRQMRYASNLDEVHFNDQLLTGAAAAADGDEQLARDKLTACFDLLAEERDHYYSVDAFLIDLTLTAEQTLGPPLRDELAQPVPTNVLMAPHLGQTLASDDPETFAALQAAVSHGDVGLISGDFREARLPLLSCESILREIRRGLAAWQTACDVKPEVFGRRRFGLTPFLPQILDKLGFLGVLHATLDDGRFPLGNQTKTRWEGIDGAAIDAIAKPPLDATKPETFLSLATKLDESMDMDHVATLSFAHWPGQPSVWYEDLRRCSQYGTALGKFVTVGSYFRDSHMPGHLDRFEADQYRSPYLKQAIIRRETDPISTWQRYWARSVAADAAQALAALKSLVTGDVMPGPSDDLLAQIDTSAENPDCEGLDDSINQEVEAATAAFAACLPRSDTAAEAGYLVANPFSFVRRVGVELPNLTALPDIEKPVYAAAETETTKCVVVDVPPLGFVWVTPGKSSTKRQRPAPPLAEDLRPRANVIVLHNEFLEASIDPTTGALAALKDYKSRGNRLSQQLGLRNSGARLQPGESWRNPDEHATYSVMAADTIEILSATSAYGEIRILGRLLDRDGKRQAIYRQTYSLWRGSRILHLSIDLEREVEPAADPWKSYYACRFAWADEAAILYRGVNQARYEGNSKHLDAPLYFDIQSGELRTTILTAGLPYHRRIGDRMLDTLLAIRGERRQVFRLGIGIDLPQPHNEAIGLLAPPTATFQNAPPPSSGSSSWLFHVDARNVVATFWEPLVEESCVVGYRVRLLETAGRATRARLSSFREVASARHMDFVGEPRGDCQVNEGRVQLELSANEWIEVEVYWA